MIIGPPPKFHGTRDILHEVGEEDVVAQRSDLHVV
jgi:hypothetical protein